ncbi:hypothetical protein F4815DRAFT_490062 [Daldinia loculata]|nr:hypothetical protein F4815DRAFT_490062 [Daldinia loculata]
MVRLTLVLLGSVHPSVYMHFPPSPVGAHIGDRCLSFANSRSPGRHVMLKRANGLVKVGMLGTSYLDVECFFRIALTLEQIIINVI